MRIFSKHGGLLTTCLALLLICAFSPSAVAYPQYSISPGVGNCAACHGDFRDNNYISLSDGMNWGNLHNMHREDVLSGDCNVCHMSGDHFPVFTYQSAGGAGMEAISCTGCHGREEDNHPGNPQFPHGYDAGLRQHHFTAGVTICATCHEDADPAMFAAVGENVPPPYFANPGVGHPNIPSDPCNADGSENFRGDPEGLDNDGDGLYDTNDPDCAMAGCWLNCPGEDGGLMNMDANGTASPDIDANGSVNVVDFALFAAAFGGADPCSDFNCSGAVNVVDFALFAAHFTHGPGPVGVCNP
jgi:hypothetical protein